MQKAENGVAEPRSISGTMPDRVMQPPFYGHMLHTAGNGVAEPYLIRGIIANVSEQGYATLLLLKTLHKAGNGVAEPYLIRGITVHVSEQGYATSLLRKTLHKELEMGCRTQFN